MRICDDGTALTLQASMGTGGNNGPMVLCIRERCGCEGGGKGLLIQDNVSGTIATSNDQFIVPIEITGGAYAMSTGSFMQIEEECTPTMCARDYKDPLVVCYSLDRASFNQGRNAQFDIGIDDGGGAHTLVAKGPNAVAYGVPLNFRPENTHVYEEKSTTICNGTNPDFHQGVIEVTPINLIVRRLTPTECARLQGMPDWWCDDLAIEEPTEEDIDLWMDRFETWRKISDPKKKPKSRKQVEKWLKNPNSDSAEYKMWGNGMDLHCIIFVIQETVRVLRERELDKIMGEDK